MLRFIIKDIWQEECLMSKINYSNRFNKIEKLEPDNLPNFYFTGPSVGLLEETASELVKILERKKMISFKGLFSFFSIIMPYYDSFDKAEQFMNRLLDSYSIARDCYDQYKGIIIIECSGEWCEYGYNQSLEQLITFIGKHKEICFFVLMPEKKSVNYKDSIYGELTKNQLWIRYECKTMNIPDCVSLFCNEMEASGYSVTKEAKNKLVALLKDRSEFLTDNKSTVLLLAKQLCLNKLFQSAKNTIICESDLDIISGFVDRKNGAGIGFNAKIR